MRIFTTCMLLCCCVLPASCSICGQLNDGNIHIPPNWDTFAAPAKGQSYVDPVFGCTVTRLTNASNDETTWDGTYVSFMDYYSTFATMNATDTLLFIYSDDGNWRIRDINANTVVSVSNMPNMNAGHPVWDSVNGNVFYYALNNSLYEGTVSGSSVVSTALHTFSEYSQGIVSPDSADLSQDGDHIALVGQNANNTMDVFVWSLSRQNKTSAYTTTCTISGSIIYSAQPSCLHKLQLTADNLLSIEFENDGSGAEEGLRLWTGSALTPLQNKTSHYDTGYDLNGNPIFISQDNANTLPGITDPCASGWGVNVRQIHNVQSAFCLLDNVPSYHMSFRGGTSQPWVALSFFDDRSSGPEFYTTDTDHYQAPTASNWQLYEDEIVLAKADASAVYRLAHVRSRSEEPYVSPNPGYWAQPRASISRDGRYVVFTSTMAFSGGCPANMHVAGECLDVYVIEVQPASMVQISPTSVTLNTGQSQTFGASGGAGPYTFSVVVNNSGGSINATTGVYTAGCVGGVTDTVRVTANGGNTSDATVTVNSSSANISFVQVVSPGYMPESSRSATITETAGDLLVVGVYWNADAATINVSDTLGNAYLATPEINSQGGGWGTQVQLFYAQSIVGGSNTVTVTQSTGTHPLGLFVLEYSGIRSSSALDVTAGQVAPISTSAMSTGSMTTTGCNDLVVALFNDTSFGSGSITAGSGFTSRAQDSAFISMVEDNVPGVGRGSINSTATLPSATHTWAATATAFRSQ